MKNKYLILTCQHDKLAGKFKSKAATSIQVGLIRILHSSITTFRKREEIPKI